MKLIGSTNLQSSKTKAFTVLLRTWGQHAANAENGGISLSNGNRSKGVARPSGRSRVSNRSVSAALGTTLGGRLQGNRSRMVWTADENQGRRLTGKFISQVQLVERFREPA